MKKMYSFLTLLLLLIGTGTVRAGYELSGTQTEVGDGDCFTLTIDIARPAADATALTNTAEPTFYYTDLRSGKAKASTMALPEALSSNYIWQAELLTTDGDGVKWFAVKNLMTGTYIGCEMDADASPENTTDDGDAGFWFDNEGQANQELSWGARMTMVAEKAQAAPIAFMHPLKGVPYVGKTVPTVSLTEGMDLLMPISYKEVGGTRYHLMLNYAYGAYWSSYADFACWFSLYEASEADGNAGFLADLKALLDTYPSKYVYGNWAGCIADEQLVNDYNAAYDAADEAYTLASASKAELQALFDRFYELAKKASAAIIPMQAGNYRFLSAYPEYMAQQEVYKAMQVDDNHGMTWATLNESSAAQIWVLTEADSANCFYMQNYKTKEYVKAGDQSTQFTTAAAKQNYVIFGQIGGGAFTMQVKGSEGGYKNMHTGGHGSGAGVSGTIVGWSNGGTPDASAWNVVPLSDDEMLAILNAEQQAERNAAMATLISTAKEKYNHALIMPEPIVTDASWITSPHTETREGSIAALIDNDVNTYWHSSWEAVVAPMVHYLQYDLHKAYGLASMKWCRRNGALNDWPKSLVLYGSNAPGTDNSLEGYDSLCRVEIPDPTLLTVQYIENIDLKNKQYIRIYCDSVGTNPQRGYWHAAELNFFDGATVDGKLPQTVAEAGAALKAALDVAEAVDSVTQADIDALQAAYDAFIASYPDPSALLAAIEKAKSAKNLSVGEGELKPGQTTAAAVAAIEAVLTAAQKYVDQDPNLYTQEGLAAQLAAVEKAIIDFRSSVAMPDTKHWYHIVCPTVFSTDKYNYNPADGEAALVGSVIAVDGDATSLSGTQMHMVGADTLDANRDNALWRFVAITDSSYAIQNKATGLYINLNATTGPRAISSTPGMFRFAPYADRIFNLVGTSIDGKIESCVHMQVANHVVVAWPTRGDDGLKNGSSWQIDPVELVAEDYEAEQHHLLAANKVYAMCYPFGISKVSTGTLFTLASVTDEGVGLMVAEKGVAPGQPFYYCNDVEAASKDTTVVVFTVDDNLTSVAGTANDGVLVGTLVNVQPGAGCGYIQTKAEADGTKEAAAKSNTVSLTAAGTTIGGGECYITLDGKTDVIPNEVLVDCDLVLLYTDKPLSDAIEKVIAETNTVAVKGIYTISGQKLNGIAKRGLYIVNGKKVMVK